MLSQRLYCLRWFNPILAAAMLGCGLPPCATVLAAKEGPAAATNRQDPVRVMEQVFRAAETETLRPGADPSDIEARAEALNHDARAIFEFLRDRITLEPYSGVLRGARGTLAAGAGNALDRALLAQALLKAGGIESRVVAGELSDAQAQKLLVRYLEADPLQGPLASCISQQGEASADAAAAELATKAGLAVDQVRDTLRRAAARTEAFGWKTDEDRASQTEFLSGQLQAFGVKPETDGAPLSALLRTRLKEHYWLQAKDATGAWSDFDPSFSDARRGTAYGAQPRALAEIPKEKFHRFGFSLVYRTKEAGKPKQETILEGAFNCADTLFAPLQFRVQPAEPTADGDAMASLDARRKIEALRKIERFQGILQSGRDVKGGRPFDLKGNTYDVKADGSLGSPGQIGQAVGGMMGGLGGFLGSDDEPAKAPAEFVDLQVVLRLDAPGSAPFTQSRTLVLAADLKSPTFAPPLLEWDILVQPQWISADLAAYQVLSHLVASRDLITRAWEASQGRGTLRLPARSPPPVPQQLLQLALLRQNATAGILAGNDGLRALIDEPLLTIAGHRLSALLPKEGRVLAQRSIDIVRNSVCFVAKDGAAQAAAFDAALRQGVADCALEHRLIREAYPDAATESGMTILDRTRMEKRPVLLARSQESDKLRKAGMSEADVAWVLANEPQDALLVIAKPASGSAAWWSVQPDGNAVLRVSGGFGQAHVEHEVDIMLIALKVMFGLICGFEVYHAGHAEPSGMMGWKLVWCMLATGASGGFLLAEAHLFSWVLICLEAAEFMIAGAME
jgi:hypothetical protein